MSGISEGSGNRPWNAWRVAGWSLAGLVLLVPLVAMQFTDEVNWGLEDFLFAGALLGGTGLVFELAAKKSRNRAYRLAVGLALGGAFALIWGNAAVGIVGSEDNPLNRIYAGVLAVGFLGAVIARFRPAGLSRAMYATAFAQTLAAVIVLILGWGQPWAGLLQLLALHGFFAAVFATSGMLFRRAAS